MDKRPAGISIISFIYLLIACLGLFSSFSPSSANLFATATMLLMGVSAVGYYSGKKWAWWIVSTLTLFSIATNLIQLQVVLNHTGSVSNILKYYLLIGGKAVIQILILVFMFSTPVIKFFSLEKLKRTNLFFVLLAITVTVFLGFKLFAFLMRATHR